jgi:DNA-directed RNA polymerase subunit RPC12/RpoP
MSEKKIITSVPAAQGTKSEGLSSAVTAPVRASAATGVSGGGKAFGAQSAIPGAKPAASPKATQPIEMGPPQRHPAPLREFKFLCVFCGKKLAAPESMAGKSITCPECRNAIEVPTPALTPPTPKQRELGVRYRKPPVFKFHCIRCGQGLEAERSETDTQAFCPTCHSRITIPRPADE